MKGKRIGYKEIWTICGIEGSRSDWEFVLTYLALAGLVVGSYLLYKLVFWLAS